MKKTTFYVLTVLLALGLFSGLASANELTAQQKFDALVEKGIFTGMGPDLNAELDQNMTRAQFAKVAALLYGLEVDNTPSNHTFTDVTSDHWAYAEIQVAANAGLFQGHGNGTFNPNGEVTLEQLAAVMTRVLDIELDATATFDGGVSDWAQKYVSAALNAGIIDSNSDFKAPAIREAFVTSAYSTDELQAAVQTVKGENKPAIGKLLALGVMAADEDQFKGAQAMSKEDVLKALGSMTNDKFDASGLDLPGSPTFADILRAYLQALGYPADLLKDSSQLIDKAVTAGIVSEDSPLLKVQQLNVSVNREWGSYLTAGTLFSASLVTVDGDGNVKLDAGKKLSQTMKLPDTPIKVELKDIEGVPTFNSLNNVDPSINTRLTSIVSWPVFVDTTAPIITEATINESPLEIINGANGTFSAGSDVYLTSGTISVSEASTLTITSIGNLNLLSYPSVSFTQSLSAGSNSLNLISKLGELDSQDNGVTMGYLMSFGDSGSLVISGTLTDGAGNSREVSLTLTI